jgi:hypothetical protein
VTSTAIEYVTPAVTSRSRMTGSTLRCRSPATLVSALTADPRYTEMTV